MNLATHLEFLKAVPKKFDSITTYNKNVLIWYFQYRFRPSIRAQLDKPDCNLKDWNEAIKKAINTKFKFSH